MFFLTLLLILTENARRRRQLENDKSKDKRKYERQTDEVRSSINDRRRSKRNGDTGTAIQLPMLPSVYSYYHLYMKVSGTDGVCTMQSVVTKHTPSPFNRVVTGLSGDEDA
jgi:hypothetical protein